MSCCSPRSLQIHAVSGLEVCLCHASLGFDCSAITVVQCPIFVPLCIEAQSQALELKLKINPGGIEKSPVSLGTFSKLRLWWEVCGSYAPVRHSVWILEAGRKIWDGLAAIFFIESSHFVRGGQIQ